MNYYIVGCGGVCSYFLPPFLKTLKHHKKFKKSTVHLVDGDQIEQKNYDRQMFQSGAVGKFKSDALKEQYSSKEYIEQIKSITEYLTDSFCVKPKSMLIGFVDNHPARKDMLTLCDRFDTPAIFGANSTIGAQAYYYHPKWQGSRLDPRVRFPEILTTDTGSPIRAAGCNTEAKLDDVPQTAIANQLAATHALHLWNFWSIEAQEMDEQETFGFWPVESRNTFSRFQTVTAGDLTTDE